MTKEIIEKDQLIQILNNLNIEIDTVDHPQVFTVDQALPFLTNIKGKFAKNLFLKDKKNYFWLLCAPHDAQIKLNDVTKIVGASGTLRFADENLLYEKLGVKEGAVTVFGLINDKDNDVRLILDKSLTDGTIQCVYFHPLVNDASIGISQEGLAKFLKYTGHVPILVTLNYGS